ncbi:hypothetical protein Agau_P200606 (plasmid) [Agrobacterium tumefaciens F2]|nr:hypothetical protein Agau_P200606 [Agrobacterium tumefaciens F2]
MRRRLEQLRFAGYGEIRTYLDVRSDEAPRNTLDWMPATRRRSPL